MTQPQPEKDLDEPRVAIVFIHGQGQQRPMESVQELARTAISANPDLLDSQGKPRRIWTVPDTRLGVADVERVTTEAGRGEIRYDLFEFYWAHLMAGNRLSDFATWFRRLQDRPRMQAPRALAPVRQFVLRAAESLALIAAAFALAVCLALAPNPGVPPAVAGLDIGMSAAALVLLVVAAGLVTFNEVRGGAPPKPKSAALGKLRAAAMVAQPRAMVMIGLIAATGMMLVAFGAVRGPTLDWADARPILSLLVLFSAGLLCLRQVERAAIVGIVAAAVGFAVAPLGIAAKGAVMDFGGNLSVPWETTDWDLSPWRAMFSAMDNPWIELVALILMGLMVFAGLWAVLGFAGPIAAARHWLTRLVWTAVTWAGACALTVLIFAYNQAFPSLVFGGGAALAVVLLGGLALGALAARAFLVPVMADSARYLSRDPDDIKARQDIREAGLDLLRELHAANAAGKPYYDRILLVAHSLGSVVGYELLHHFWAQRHGHFQLQDDKNPAGAAVLARAVDDLVDAAIDLEMTDQGAINPHTERPVWHDKLQAYQARQRELAGGLRANRRWLITDFITIGSPLTHAQLLLADSAADLGRRQVERKLATCPPQGIEAAMLKRAPRSTKKKVAAAPQMDPAARAAYARQRRFTFTGYDKIERLHHGAVFAPTRWTNLYFKGEDFLLAGDVIGGPLSSWMRDPEKDGDFGPGVRDVPLSRADTGKLFAHNEYWRSDLDTNTLRDELKDSDDKLASPGHIAALIGAMALGEPIAKTAARPAAQRLTAILARRIPGAKKGAP
jgi:hypothetical protein